MVNYTIPTNFNSQLNPNMVCLDLTKTTAEQFKSIMDIAYFSQAINGLILFTILFIILFIIFHFMFMKHLEKLNIKIKSVYYFLTLIIIGIYIYVGFVKFVLEIQIIPLIIYGLGFIPLMIASQQALLIILKKYSLKQIFNFLKG